MKTTTNIIAIIFIQYFIASFNDLGHANNNTIQPFSMKSDNRSTQKVTNHENLRALAIFAAFNDRPQDKLPQWTQDIFNPNVPNSLSHYYTTQSYGQHTITGDVINHWFYADSGYHSGITKQQFVRSILKQVDTEINFSQYDIRNKSGESKPDGIVDMMIFINIADNKWHSNPDLCLLQHPCYYITNDNVNGYQVKIHTANGTTQDYQRQLVNQVGIIAHEYGHTLKLKDLYDLTYYTPGSPPNDYSAGIGFWGLMGEGYGMWGLYSFCAFSKMKLGWISVKQISSNTSNLHVKPGTVYKICPPAFSSKEYFLISYRDHSNFYDRKLPSGLLIWHIDESLNKNTNEYHKFVDLECADGLYSGAGQPDPISGGDNLDYWAKFDSLYTNIHNGNKYDDTDPFDGGRYTAFTPYTNPNSNGYSNENPNKQSNVSKLAVTNIRPGGFCDIIFKYWKGELKTDTVWKTEQSPYYLGGNIYVPTGVTLQIESGTIVEYNGHSVISNGGTIIQDNVVTSLSTNQESPADYGLFHNYPNPFNPTTTIQYELIQPADVLLKIYNSAGQEVKILIDQPQRAGTNSVKWDGTDNEGAPVSSGVYLCKMETAAGYQTIKMLLLR